MFGITIEIFMNEKWIVLSKEKELEIKSDLVIDGRCGWSFGRNA